MKALLSIICLIMSTSALAIEQVLPQLDKNEAIYCAKYGTFVADAAKLRDKGTAAMLIVSTLRTNYPDADEAYIAEAVFAAISFKEYTPDWIGGFITGKCVGLTQSRKAKYIPL